MLAAEYKTQEKNCERRATSHGPRRKAFTLVELAVAVALLAMMISFASLIFDMSIDTHRVAMANAEIMQKLQAITSQLNADFEGLRKDGEIFVVWVTSPAGVGENDYDQDGYIRFDRIMFFAEGDFQSYGTNPMVYGNLARISYMLAKRNGVLAWYQEPQERILARTQHTISAIPDHGFLDIDSFTPDRLDTWHNTYEYDTNSLEEWKNIPWQPGKAEILSAITDIIVGGADGYQIGAQVNPADANSIHMLLCEGVGEFKVQGWYAAEQRWVPEVDNEDFYDPNTNSVPGVLYPYRELPPPGEPYGGVAINGIPYLSQLVDEAHFDMIPGLGRALKFTFTLYDSKGILEGGRTFTHIVYLD